MKSDQDAQKSFSALYVLQVGYFLSFSWFLVYMGSLEAHGKVILCYLNLS